MPIGFDEFLKEVTPLFDLQWRPFQRRGIKRKVERRIAEIGLSDFEKYLSVVKNNSQEQKHLSKILTVTISRFFRDREVFNTISLSIFPRMLEEENRDDLRIWSIGCASGEEPYTLSILWKERFEKIRPQVRLSILATDIAESMLERAKEGRYKRSSLNEVSEEILKKYFKIENESYILTQKIQESVEFRSHNILRNEPFLGIDIVFCRNLAFTYFSKEGQIEVLRKIATSLGEDGYLVIGKDESLPLTYPTLFAPIFPAEQIYQKFTRQTI